MNENDQNIQIREPGQMKQRLLVLVRPGQISEQLVRWTHHLARTLNCWWGAVYVEASSTLSEHDQEQLSRTMAVARSLGAEVITRTDADMVRGLLRTAIESSASQIIIGKQAGKSYRGIFRDDKWVKRLLEESGEFDIHVVGLKEETASKTFLHGEASDWWTLLKHTCCGVLPTMNKVFTQTRPPVLGK